MSTQPEALRLADEMTEYVNTFGRENTHTMLMCNAVVELRSLHAEVLRAAPAQAPAPCTCPSGDGSLRWPCPVHPQVVDAATAPVAPGEPLKGWKFNHARQHPDPDQGGAWEIGFLDDEDDRFSAIVTVDTGLYYEDDQAEPLAKAILARLQAASAPAPRQHVTDGDIERIAYRHTGRPIDSQHLALIVQVVRSVEQIQESGAA
jgi:hypothetical protein